MDNVLLNTCIGYVIVGMYLCFEGASVRRMNGQLYQACKIVHHGAWILASFIARGISTISSGFGISYIE